MRKSYLLKIPLIPPLLNYPLPTSEKTLEESNIIGSTKNKGEKDEPMGRRRIKRSIIGR